MQLIIRDLIYRSPLKYNAARNIIFFDTYHPGKPNANNILKEAYEKPLREYSNHLKNKK